MAKPLTLQDWIAFNDEIAALVRAGIPLDQGLTVVGEGLDGRLGRELKATGERIANGEPLAEAIAHAAPGLPASYKAAIEAGNASGNLSVALSSFANAARNMRDLRVEVGNALLYPIIVVGSAYIWIVLLFQFLLNQYLPGQHELLQEYPRISTGLFWIRDNLKFWAPVPLIFFVIFVVNWFWSGWRRGTDPTSAAWILSWLPAVRKLLQLLKQSRFAELLALMVDQGVPLQKAFYLAAEATGDRELIASATRAQQRISQGETLTHSLINECRFPGVLRWAIVSGAQQDKIADALRNASETLKIQVRWRAEFVGQFLPGFILIAVGGFAVTVYCLSVFLPFTAALRAMSGLEGG